MKNEQQLKVLLSTYESEANKITDSLHAIRTTIKDYKEEPRYKVLTLNFMKLAGKIECLKEIID